MISIKAIWLGLAIATASSAAPAVADDAIPDCENTPYFEFSLNPLYLSDDPYALVIGASLAYQSIVTFCPEGIPEADLREAMMSGQIIACPKEGQVTCRSRSANSDYSASDFMYRASLAGSSDPLILHQLANYCLRMSQRINECRREPDDPNCALSPHRESEVIMCQGDFIRDLSRVDPDNSHSWVLYAQQSYAAHNPPHALEMLQRAVQRKRYDIYFPQQTLQFADTAMEYLKVSESDAFIFSAGMAASSLTTTSAYSICMKEARSKSAWADACLALGVQMEAIGRTRMTTMLGLALQKQVLELQGPSTLLSTVTKRLEEKRQWRSETDEELLFLPGPTGELYVYQLYQNMIEHGEEEAFNMFERDMAANSRKNSSSP